LYQVNLKEEGTEQNS